MAWMQDGETHGIPESRSSYSVPSGRTGGHHDLASRFRSNLGPFDIWAFGGSPVGVGPIRRAKAHGFCSTPADDLTLSVDGGDHIGVSMACRDGRVSVRLGVESNSSQHCSFAAIDGLPKDVAGRSVMLDTAPFAASRGGGITLAVGCCTCQPERNEVDLRRVVPAEPHCLQTTAGNHVTLDIEAEHGEEVFGRGDDSVIGIRRRIRAERCDKNPVASLRPNLQSPQLPRSNIEIVAGQPFATDGRSRVALARRTMELDCGINVREFEG